MIINTVSERQLPIHGWGIELTKLAKDLELTYNEEDAETLSLNDIALDGEPALYKGMNIDKIFIYVQSQIPLRDDDCDSVIIQPTYSQILEKIILKTIAFFNNTNERLCGEEKRGAITDYVNKHVGLICAVDYVTKTQPSEIIDWVNVILQKCEELQDKYGYTECTYKGNGTFEARDENDTFVIVRTDLKFIDENRGE